MKREAELKSVGSPRRYLVVASQTPSGPGATGGVVQLALATVVAQQHPAGRCTGKMDSAMIEYVPCDM